MTLVFSGRTQTTTVDKEMYTEMSDPQNSMHGLTDIVGLQHFHYFF
jgi:hypothetical protein